jgi:hypothetical protein
VVTGTGGDGGEYGNAMEATYEEIVKLFLSIEI